MLAIRLQRTGRSGHAQFRLIAQDSRFSPTSGRVVAYLGSYDPHTKQATIDKDKAAGYLSKGAQPSERAAKLLKAEGVKLPTWVAKPLKQKGEIRNPEKLRRNRPAGAPTPEPKAEAAPEGETPAEAPGEEAAAETPAETEVAAPEKPADETPTELEKTAEPVEESSVEAKPTEPTEEPITEAPAEVEPTGTPTEPEKS